MENITLALAILLGGGFLSGRLCQLIRLPSVTGYICVGLLLGPSGLNLIPGTAVGNQLQHFIQLALMMISFGIGEHMEIARLRSAARSLALIGIAEACGAFLMVSSGSLLVMKVSGLTAVIPHAPAVALLLGTVSIATAPATVMHVIRENKASGPLTTMLLAVIALDNGLAIMAFGVAMAIVNHLNAAGQGGMLAMISASILEIAGSLIIGVITGLLLDFINSHMSRKSDMLTGGLAILLLCGEAARLLNMSPLLAGMAAGFTVINREHRDSRLFRALNAFEPPIYVLFFTLAGVHLNLAALSTAGWLGLTYFFCRTIGKIGGAGVGSLVSSAPLQVKRYLGLALTPQAGVAIGLIFLISNNPASSAYAEFITQVVLAGVLLSEISGPIFANLALKLADELPADPPPADKNHHISGASLSTVPAGVPLVPWTWPRLSHLERPEGVVLFGVSHIATGAALARIAAIIAHFHQAYPLMLRVVPPAYQPDKNRRADDQALISAVQSEVQGMGSELYTIVKEENDVASAILETARQSGAWAIVMGCSPLPVSQRICSKIIENAPCPTLIIKFGGVFHTERILVPIISLTGLDEIRIPLRAMAAVGRHKITLLLLMSSSDSDKDIKRASQGLEDWAAAEGLSAVTNCQILATEARKDTVLTEAASHDLLIMAAPPPQALAQRLLFGSLYTAIAQGCEKTMITVYPASNL
ncbi:cation:proton antiporter [Desulfobacterota bacterium M19]